MENKRIDWVKSEIRYKNGYARTKLVLQDGTTCSINIRVVEDWSYEDEFDYFHYVLYGYVGTEENKMHISVTIDDDETALHFNQEPVNFISIKGIHPLDGIRLVNCIERSIWAEEDLLQD